ncbi:hypothetical protein Cgig2_006740 [Carnegiea gigantea]|uniref:Beta-glucosidase n=1 Tax=Carnegiea gigantea TaxID=171969 RepID=A0A9Q1GVV4_9CARY|nr:hypothetical protein Cgig2_006740 [Carnegiea gigantea]
MVSTGSLFPPFGTYSAGNSDIEPLIVVHNMLLSHAKAVQLYRKQFMPEHGGRNIGVTVGPFDYEPDRDDEFSYQAAERAYAFSFGWMLDPLAYGGYSCQMREYLGTKLPKFSQKEMKLVKGSVDFFGINHFSSVYAIDCLHYSTNCSSCRHHHAVLGMVCISGYRDGVPIGGETGNAQFFVVPYGIEKVIEYVQKRYRDITIYVTENGKQHNS